MSKPLAKLKGRLIAVVGPSGAGKDSLIAGLRAARPDLRHARRVITRRAGAGGEVFDAVSDTRFATDVAQGAFALHWQAHGLSYGIPKGVHDVLAQGRDVLANLSRGILAEAAQVFDAVVVLHVTAPPHVLAQRVADRGREGARDVQHRLSRQAPAMPDGLTVVEVDNSGPLEDTVAAALHALYPERG